MRDKRSLEQKSPREPCRKKRRTGPAPRATRTLRLKIQRLRGENFFISVSRSEMITKLKQQVFSFLQSAPGWDVRVEVTNIRLIYKGSVLADEKSIEFYHIQNEDTIQLVPFRRRRCTTQSRTERQSGETSCMLESPAAEEVWADNFSVAVITFSPSFMEEPSREENRHSSISRNEVWRPVDQMHRGRTASSTSRRPRPITSSVLDSFKNVLVTTNFQLQLAERQRQRGRGQNEQRALLSQLHYLIRQATLLRDDLFAELQSPAISPEPLESTFHTTAESGLVTSTDDEKIQSSTEEERTEDLLPGWDATRTLRVQSSAATPPFVLFRSDEMNILGNSMTPPPHLHLLQNNESPRYRQHLDLSPLVSPAPSEDDGGDTLHFFFPSIIVNSSLSNQSLSPVNDLQEDTNAIIVPLDQAREQQQPQRVNISSASRTQAVTTEPVNTTSNSGDNPEENNGITTASRLRNMFVQFLNSFIN